MCLSIGLHRLRESSVKQGKTGQYALRVSVYLRNGKEHGIYYRILGLYSNNGTENGNYYSILGFYRV